MSKPSISDPGELDHVISLIEEDVKGLPHTAQELRSLLETMADDARTDLIAEKFAVFDLTDAGEVHYILSHPPFPPAPGKVFAVAFLNTLEEAAAKYLGALLVSIRFPEMLVYEEVERIESLARALIIERINRDNRSLAQDALSGKKSKEGGRRHAPRKKKPWGLALAKFLNNQNRKLTKGEKEQAWLKVHDSPDDPLRLSDGDGIIEWEIHRDGDDLFAIDSDADPIKTHPEKLAKSSFLKRYL